MADPAYIVDGVLTDGEAWVGIAHAAVSLPAASLTFTSTDDGQTGDFSQYMDLVLISYCRNARADTFGTTYFMRFNNDAGSNYIYQLLEGNGSAAAASSSAATTNVPLGLVPRDNDAANVYSASVAHLFDINSGKYKSAVAQNASDWDGEGKVQLTAGTWKSQAAITEIDIYASSFGYDITAGSMFSLFGVLPRMVA
tara:strand:- start:486 stop:1076 length:591 start_codon:yes stop_codon:yes gene_type:complete